MEKLELITLYVCESCSTRHDSELEAEDCCPVRIEEVYICPVCKAEFDEFKFTDAMEHLKMPHTGTGVIDSHDLYIESLIFEPGKYLGEWHFEIENENEVANV